MAGGIILTGSVVPIMYSSFQDVSLPIRGLKRNAFALIVFLIVLEALRSSSQAVSETCAQVGIPRLYKTFVLFRRSL